jgi:hypothetical protein
MVQSACALNTLFFPDTSKLPFKETAFPTLLIFSGEILQLNITNYFIIVSVYWYITRNFDEDRYKTFRH